VQDAAIRNLGCCCCCCWCQVAAPNPLPAGFQVQLYDMEGFKLSYVMGDMLTLFKVSSCESFQ
jgi:hypothetical protein